MRNPLLRSHIRKKRYIIERESYVLKIYRYDYNGAPQKASPLNFKSKDKTRAQHLGGNTTNPKKALTAHWTSA